MEIANKYELIDGVVVRVNDLAEMKGIDKCVAVVDIIQKINFLVKVLKDEDSIHDAAIKELTEKIDALKKNGDDGGNEKTDPC